MEKVNTIKDLGVTFDPHLKFDQHVHEKIKNAYSILGLLNRNFSDMPIKAFVQLYKTLVRPHVEYANAVWAPHHKMLFEEIEKVQMRATN